MNNSLDIKHEVLLDVLNMAKELDTYITTITELDKWKSIAEKLNQALTNCYAWIDCHHSYDITGRCEKCYVQLKVMQDIITEYNKLKNEY